MTRHKSTSSTQRTYQDPPDGGWGWMVVIAGLVVLFIVRGIQNSVGIFFPVLLNYFGEGAGATAWMATFVTAMSLLSGPFAAALSKRFSHRTVVISGGLLAAASLSITYFAPNVMFISVTYGVFTGVAFGLSRIPTVAMAGRYFKKRHAIASGCTVIGSGSGSFLMPPLAGYLIDHYGWRGSFLVMGGIASHICVAGALLRPIYLKGDIEGDDLMNSKESVEQVVHQGKPDASKVSPRQKCMRCSQCLSGIVSYFDLSLFKNSMYVIMLTAYLFFGFGMNIQLVHIVNRALITGVSSTQAPLIISAFGVCLMTAGLLQGFVVDLLHLSKCRCIGVVIVGHGLSGIALAFTYNYIAMCVLMAAMGLCRGVFAGLNSVTMRIIAGDAKFTGAYGMSTAFIGAGQLIGPVVAGYMYDYTQDYTYPFLMGGTTVLAGGVLVLVGNFVRERSRSKAKQRREREDSPDLEESNGDRQMARGECLRTRDASDVELILLPRRNRHTDRDCIENATGVSSEQQSTV